VQVEFVSRSLQAEGRFYFFIFFKEKEKEKKNTTNEWSTDSSLRLGWIVAHIWVVCMRRIAYLYRPFGKTKNNCIVKLPNGKKVKELTCLCLRGFWKHNVLSVSVEQYWATQTLLLVLHPRLGRETKLRKLSLSSLQLLYQSKNAADMRDRLKKREQKQKNHVNRLQKIWF